MTRAQWAQRRLEKLAAALETEVFPVLRGEWRPEWVRKPKRAKWRDAPTGPTGTDISRTRAILEGL